MFVSVVWASITDDLTDNLGFSLFPQDCHVLGRAGGELRHLAQQRRSLSVHMIVRTKREAFLGHHPVDPRARNGIGRSIGKEAAAWLFAIRVDDGRHADWGDLSRASDARSRCRICVLGCLGLDSAAGCVLRRSAVSARRRRRSRLGHRGDQRDLSVRHRCSNRSFDDALRQLAAQTGV